MTLNRHRPHVLVLPEDDANRQIANGFILGPVCDERQIQTLSPAGGWRKVLAQFCRDIAPSMSSYEGRFVVLLVDFDGRLGRLEQMRRGIPEELQERVFILGTWNEPESLRKSMECAYEEIGGRLARDCAENTSITWGHDMLLHNRDEMQRLQQAVRHIFFEG